MRIVVDENILAVDDYFSSAGELIKLPGRQITNQVLLDADALLVRSVTPVDEDLLKNTRVRFVGSATSGVDHVDLDCLKQHKIKFCDAQGCNAAAVVDYFFSAVALLRKQHQLPELPETFGVVGAGNVGGLLVRKLLELGCEVRINDPLLNAAQKSALKGAEFCNLERTMGADVVSLHVPLTRSGPHKTSRLLNRENLGRLAPGTILINTSRGEVICGTGLAELLSVRDDVFAVLDVWENEPLVGADLVSKAQLATPHIAGYSLEAKNRATATLAAELGKFFDMTPSPPSDTVLTDKAVDVAVTSLLANDDSWATEVLLSVLPLNELDAGFRELVSAKRGPAAFDSMRRELASRREFSSHRVSAEKLTEEQGRVLGCLGFQID